MAPTARTRRSALLGPLLATLVLTLVTPLASLGPGSAASAAEPATDPVRVASFNVLGASLTDRPAEGKYRRWDTYEPRMRRAIRLLDDKRVEIAGLQEFEARQHELFVRRTKGAWGGYPGLTAGRRAVENTIVWRRDTWRLAEKGLFWSTTYGGRLIRSPYVRLRHVGDGRQVWVMNAHHPAEVQGPAQEYRDDAIRRGARVANRLLDSGIPVVFTGDFNSKERVFCEMLRLAPRLQAANGGSVEGGQCTPPDPMRIDWIFLADAVRVLDYRALQNARVLRITDHPLVTATVSLPPV